MADPTPIPRRTNRLGALLIGAAAGYALAQWMSRNNVSWNQIGQRLMPAAAPDQPLLAGRLAFARDEARRAMAERRRELEAQAGRALAPAAAGKAGEDRNGAASGQPPL